MRKIEILYVTLLFSLMAGLIIGNELARRDNRKFQQGPETVGEPIHFEKHAHPTAKQPSSI